MNLYVLLMLFRDIISALSCRTGPIGAASLRRNDEMTKNAPAADLALPLQRKQCRVNPAYITCGEVLTAAVGICGRYGFAPGVGPIVAGACIAASMYGYIQCLAANGDDGP